MNYRSRFSHQIRGKTNKFLIEEHQECYKQLCDRLKQSKALMDKHGVLPKIRTLDH